MSSKYDKIKERVALACRIAYNEGLYEHTGDEFAGHVSVRDEEDENLVIMPGHIHDKGRGFANVTKDDIIVINLDRKVIEGNIEPMEESIIHTTIYRARREIKSVTHLHAPTAVALASTDQKILMLSIRSAYFAEGVPILERGPGIILGEKDAQEMLEKMNGRNFLIHKGHGIVTAGTNLFEACLLALYLEGAARNQIVAADFGGKLVEFDRKAALDFARTHSLAEREFIWNYYENKWREETR